ncbi:helix-turn-helix domain-containing protein [Caulobacter radicis]|uniref:helix-turn-helix domain-containing protein n=1 Tax=Caulobacter radicis TaxID=2172650 RepID=UPI001FCADA8F|nr:helix-turn-helix transcriptional regulator [Caulobacter radicis]
MLVEVLLEARKRSGLRQADLADRLGKDQTFISLIERSQRRVDVLEFIALARAMNERPEALFADLLTRIPGKIEI